MRIYVASSWRNAHQPELVKALQDAGHEVYDFRHPAPGNEGFQWSQIDPNWKDWTPVKDDPDPIPFFRFAFTLNHAVEA